MDKFTKHEAIDRTHLASVYVEDTLVKHHYYESKINPEFNKLVDEATDKLAEAYQLIASEVE